ncbi:hypothetical protein NDU88_002404 [Pleurodeles waltl]|uniref:Uncharacterized protein n=1 Tax=Pleurodeles waltl TaxID=8319 RepID=A0AAV7NDM5_PLEWA|nr:hypothetical protein NDU88_002404 [Pleurodeles waltl]
MATTKNKCDPAVREMLTRSMPAAAKDTASVPLPLSRPKPGDLSDKDQAPLTWAFLASVFNSLKTDLQDLTRDLSQVLQQDLFSVVERVSKLEDNETLGGISIQIITMADIQQTQEAPPTRARETHPGISGSAGEAGFRNWLSPHVTSIMVPNSTTAPTLSSATL